MIDKPRPAPAYFPYHHDNLAVVWRREALAKFNRLPLELRKGRTVVQFMGDRDD